MKFIFTTPAFLCILLTSSCGRTTTASVAAAPAEIARPVFHGFIDEVLTVAIGSEICAIDDSGLICRGYHTEGLDRGNFAKKNPRDLVIGWSHKCVVEDSQINCRAEWYDSSKPLPPIAVKNPKHLVSGHSFICFEDEGQVQCMDPQTNSKPLYVPDDIKSVADLAAGKDYVCAVINSRKTDCWMPGARNRDEQNPRRFTLSGVPSDFVNLTEIATGELHACSIDGGKVRCWGDNSKGQLDVPQGLTHPRGIVAGSNHSCVIDDNGIQCWGNNDWKQLRVPSKIIHPRRLFAGRNNSCALHDGGLTCWGDNSFAQHSVPRSFHNIQSITAAANHTCVSDDFGPHCWGENKHGGLSIPPRLLKLKKLSVGRSHSCAIDQEGAMCWGDNEVGQTMIPASMVDAKEIWALDNFTCARTLKETKCWGITGDSGRRYLDFIEGGLAATTTAAQVIGRGHVLCSKDQSKIRCFGDNGWGGLNVPELRNPVAFDTGYVGSCAIDGTDVKCWSKSIFLEGMTFSQPTQVSVGDHHACVVDQGDVKCWGKLTYERPIVVPPGIKNPRMLASGTDHSCAVVNDDVTCWGNGEKGQLVKQRDLTFHHFFAPENWLILMSHYLYGEKARLLSMLHERFNERFRNRTATNVNISLTALLLTRWVESIDAPAFKTDVLPEWQRDLKALAEKTGIVSAEQIPVADSTIRVSVEMLVSLLTVTNDYMDDVSRKAAENIVLNGASLLAKETLTKVDADQLVGLLAQDESLGLVKYLESSDRFKAHGKLFVDIRRWLSQTNTVP